MSSPRISILMGVYNAKTTVESAVLSVERQTFSNIEFLICDDGSTDGTWLILCRFAEEYKNIVLLRNERCRGLAYSLNRCIELSNGSYIARMDADDTCAPERLERQLEFLEQNPEYDLVGTCCLMIDDDGSSRIFKKPEYPNANVLPMKTPFVHPTVMLRRTTLERLGSYTVSKRTLRCEDLELWYRFFCMGLRGYNLQEYLYFKKQGKENYRKRKLRYGIDMCVVHIQGMKKLRMKWYRYPLALKPIISSIIPKKAMIFYHKKRLKAIDIK